MNAESTSPAPTQTLLSNYRTRLVDRMNCLMSHPVLALGARRIGERVQHDASSGVLPEERAEEWAPGWLAELRAAAQAPAAA